MFNVFYHFYHFKDIQKQVREPRVGLIIRSSLLRRVLLSIRASCVSVVWVEAAESVGGQARVKSSRVAKNSAKKDSFRTWRLSMHRD